MNKTLLTIGLITLSVIGTQAQEMGFSIGGHVPNPATILDIQATNKGVLIPRINLETTTILQGGTNPEGVIVYNTGSALAHGFYYWTGSQWDMLTSDSYISNELTQMEERLETQINNIVNGGQEEGETDISYLVSYNPDTTVYSYLKPKEEGEGYDKVVIDLTAAVQVAETNTFIKPILSTVNAGTPEENQVVSAYAYFSEDAIKAWKLTNPEGNPEADMPIDLGVRIDVLGVVNNNFREIFENATNNEIINEIIKEAPNNVWVEDRGEAGTFLVYYDENKEKKEVNLQQQETQTEMFKHVVTGDGNTGPALPIEVLDVNELKDGGIYYSYKAEHGKTFYINMTNDVINSVQNSEILKKEIFNTVNEYNSLGGNVYYGKMDENSTEDVLYVIKNDVPERIDISQDILNVIENVANETIIETILERTEVKIITGATTKLNETIDGFAVYKAKYNANVANHSAAAPYNTNFDSGFGISNLQTLLSVKIVKGVELVQNSVTAVTYEGGVLNFKFGLGNLYSTLLSGDYQVIVEYVSTEKEDENKK